MDETLFIFAKMAAVLTVIFGLYKIIAWMLQPNIKLKITYPKVGDIWTEIRPGLGARRLVVIQEFKDSSGQPLSWRIRSGYKTWTEGRENWERRYSTHQLTRTGNTRNFF